MQRTIRISQETYEKLNVLRNNLYLLKKGIIIYLACQAVSDVEKMSLE